MRTMNLSMLCSRSYDKSLIALALTLTYLIVRLLVDWRLRNPEESCFHALHLGLEEHDLAPHTPLKVVLFVIRPASLGRMVPIAPITTWAMLNLSASYWCLQKQRWRVVAICCGDEELRLALHCLKTRNMISQQHEVKTSVEIQNDVKKTNLDEMRKSQGWRHVLN